MNAKKLFDEKLPLDKRFKTGEGLIPLMGDAIEVMLHGMKRARIENEAAFATGANAVDEASVLKHAEVLGDGLAGERRAGGELRDGRGLARDEPGHEREARVIAQCSKDDGLPRLPEPGSLMAFGRHEFQYSSSVASSRLRSCGRPERGDGRERSQSPTR